MKLRHGFVNSPKILNVPDFGGHHREDVRVVHNPASTWMHNEAGAASVGCIVEQYNQANYETHTRTHTFHFGVVQPCGVFSIILLVLFTFNVTETESSTPQPFITKPWEIGGHTSLSLSFLSLSVYPLHCFSLYPSINSCSFQSRQDALS